MSEAHNSSGHDSHGGHEKSDMALGAMLWIIPASLTILVVFVTVIIFLTAGAASREMNEKQFSAAEAGKVQVKALRAHEDSVLSESGTDAEGNAHMPIDKAMETLAGEKASNTAP